MEILVGLFLAVALPGAIAFLAVHRREFRDVLAQSLTWPFERRPERTTRVVSVSRSAASPTSQP